MYFVRGNMQREVIWETHMYRWCFYNALPTTDIRAWTGLNWLRIGPCCKLKEYVNEPSSIEGGMFLEEIRDC
jgi:hypothetical protein